MSDHAYRVQARLAGADYRVELDDGAGHAWAGDEPADLGGGDSAPTPGNPPAFSEQQKWSYAAIASFIAGVMPPSAMLGRSWL